MSAFPFQLGTSRIITEYSREQISPNSHLTTAAVASYSNPSFMTARLQPTTQMHPSSDRGDHVISKLCVLIKPSRTPIYATTAKLRCRGWWGFQTGNGPPKNRPRPQHALKLRSQFDSGVHRLVTSGAWPDYHHRYMCLTHWRKDWSPCLPSGPPPHIHINSCT